MGAGGSYTETAGNAVSFVVNETNGIWGTAADVKTKIAGFGAGDGDYLTNMSCPSAGNCVAGGQDQVQHNALASQVYFVTETRGIWGEAISVPNKLNYGQQAGISQITCPSVGNCGAAGWYSAAYAYGFTYMQPFFITEARGTWHNPVAVPGITILPPKDGQVAQAISISCPAADRCSGDGFWQDNNNGTNHGFVDSQS